MVLSQVKLKDMFRQLDRDRSGRLSVGELGQLVALLLPNPSEAELTYFSVRSHELLSPPGWAAGSRL